MRPRGRCPPQACSPPPSRAASAPLSVGKKHTGMSLRDTAAQINKRPPLQVCAGADNEGNLCMRLFFFF